ncbi:hypothetical protein BO94DRAFT_612015 [Aspergillus sclerotioniger CBS 115572]|uniref:Uncharacterized protein n=1 Tax=Aspergillus sclerotioniger CBS 115572 TaxID=1450535 RepID=A0A317V618_9EURO|nr:hypothetical protein BO94DRAFT_612015 [Aspergillus sclerotioniger CBS 115572]PWY67610.1 hypothetical protein BO94DRAFT_612015 [Aspergillus sclerotioniger CBS 115572]
MPAVSNPFSPRNPYHRIWFHPICYELLESTDRSSDGPILCDLGRFAAAIKPTFEPLSTKHEVVASVLEGLLSEHATNIIQNTFSQDLLRKLPPEILILIAEMIGPCWYLTVLGEHRRLLQHMKQNRNIQCTQLDLTRDIWMSRIDYRGASYVTGISNSPLESSSTSDVSLIKAPDTNSKIVLSVDGIGLRGLQLLNLNSSPALDQSPWYDVLEAENPHPEAYVSFDGLFVRGIYLEPCPITPWGITDPPTLWTSPFPPKFHPLNHEDGLNRRRLHYMKLDAHTQGLIVCCDDRMAVGIHNFSGTSKAFKEFVDLMVMHRLMTTNYNHWIYFPFNRQELITGVWIRRWKRICGPPVVVLQTSLGRIVVFGSLYPFRVEDVYEYSRLVRPDPDSKCISAFGPLPVDPPCEPRQSLTWYLSKATLKGLVKVQVCRDRSQPHHPCLGLLLFYNDKHVESIGQVRWQCDMRQEVHWPINYEVGVVNGDPYIKDIGSSNQELGPSFSTGGWQRLPDYGTMAWWSGGKSGDIISIYCE